MEKEKKEKEKKGNIQSNNETFKLRLTDSFTIGLVTHHA